MRTLGLRSLSIPIAGTLLAVIMVGLCIWPPNLFVFLDGKVYDSFLKTSAHRPVTGSVAIVDLDEDSIASLGQWPWPRYRVARLLGKIRDAGAVAVGLDMLFAEPDRTSLASLSGEIRRDLGASISLEGLPDESLNTDKALADVLAGGPFVLGYQFDFEKARGGNCVLHALPAAVLSKGGAAELKTFFDAPGVICNLPVLAKAAGSSGFFNVTPDADGVVRRVPMVIRHGGRYYPSLALAVYLRARGGETVLDVGPEGTESIRIPGKTIPLARRANLLVNYRGGRRTFPHIPARAVLDGSADTASIRGKIVLLGTTAAGLHEMRTTPLESAQPGVEIHATVIDDLIAGDPISHPRWSRGLLVLLILVPGILLSVLLARARAAWGLAAIIPSAAAIWALSWWLLTHRQVCLPPLMPIASLGLIFTILTSLRYIDTEREVQERTRRLALTQDAIIQSLAALAETRHHETGGHIQRTRHYMRALALRLKDHPRFRNYLDDPTIDLLFRLAPLHDIGKVGVPDQILLKPARLTIEEYAEMKKHTTYGSETIRLARNFLGEDSFLQVADEIALNHHERWDGSGYPRGLRGTEIPIPGRLMAIADSYDAIISPRLYKPAISHKEAIRLIRNLRGVYFDPDAVDAFMEVSVEFEEIASRFASSGVEPEPPKGF
ncbi:MAG: CHASE2 domain-containing protein [Deltaproteobacteria bacterium]|nr:CHASE2 domain-containing protein [Deltaproteobacteria bacterium]